MGGVYWLASAMEVRSRLWLGSVISRHRDGKLIGGLLIRVRRCGPVEKILLVTDGLASYASQALKVFRKPLLIAAKLAVRGWCCPQESHGRRSHKVLPA